MIVLYRFRYTTPIRNNIAISNTDAFQNVNICGYPYIINYNFY